MYSTLSFLSVLTATAFFFSAASSARAEGGDSQNNPDKVCKYKKKGCSSCSGGNCDQDSSPDEDVKTKTVGHDEECPDPVTAGFGEDYEFAGEEQQTQSARASRAALPPVTIRSGFSADFINPKNLKVYGQGAEIVRDGNAHIRQVKTDTGFLDIVSTSATKTVELRQYKPEDIGTKKVNGLYPVLDGKTPLVVLRYVQESDNTIRVDTIDTTAEFPSVKSERTSQTVGPEPYTLTQQKTYLKGEGLSATEYRRVSKTITAIPNGRPKEEKYHYTVEDMGTDGQWYVTERKTGRRAMYKEEDGLVPLYECDAANEDGTPMTPIATETTRTYYDDPLKPESFGKVKTLRRNDGYWENKYYDANANAGVEIEKTESPWLNTAAHEPGASPQGPIRTRTEVTCSTDTGLASATETVNGITLTREWTEKFQVNSQQVREVRHQPHSGGDKVTTTIRYRRAKDIPTHLSGKPISVHNANGSMNLYTYSLNGQDLTITEDMGYGSGNVVTHGTRTVSTQDKDSGNLKEEIRYALEGGQAYWLGSKTGVSFDNKGVALKWIYDNNPEDYTEQQKDCCHITSERGRDGITTTYTYDAAGRKTSATTRGITTSTEYKGLTTIDWKQAVGSTQKYLVEQTENNLAGRTIKRTDPVVGNKTAETTYASNVPERTTEETTPFGTTRITRNYADDQKKSETGTTGITTTYAYTPGNAQGRGKIMVAADGNRTVTTTQDQLGNTISETLGENIVTTYTYDTAARVKSRTLPDGEKNLWEYGSDGVIVTGIDRDGDGVLNPSTDRMQKMEKIFDSSWPEDKGSWKTLTSSAWQGNWKEISLTWTTEDGTLTRRQIPGRAGYETLEQPSPSQKGVNYTVKTTMPAGQSQETTYALDNGVVTGMAGTWKDSAGNVVLTSENTLDVWGNQLTSVDPRTGTTTYSYDAGTGTPLSVTAPGNLTTSYQYDDWGRRVATVLPDGSQQHAAYDTEGNITRQWGSQLYPVSYEYDAYGRKTGMLTYRTPVGENAGWPEGTEGDHTTWIYDSVTGNLTQKKYADDKGMTYTYTPGGKPKTTINARGNITTYTYNATGELLSVTVNDNGITPAQNYTYDQWGRQTSAITAGVASWVYTYNDQGQTLEEEVTMPAADGDLVRKLERSYDPYGRPTGYQLKHGDTTEQTVTYAYDAMGRMSGVTADGKEFTYTYLPNTPQLLSQVTSPVHIVENTWEPTRDTLSVKTNKWKNKANTPVISAYAYTVNNLGQRTSVTTSGEVYSSVSADRVWSYDSLGQVIIANDNHYTYDQIGNRTSTQKATELPQTYTVNALNQYASIGSLTPTYDADGNQLTGLQATPALPERNQLTFVYNAQNRPIQVKQNSTIRENYTYDHQGRRTQKEGTLTLYDGYNAIAEYDFNTRSLKTTYTWGYDLSGTLLGAGGVNGLLSVKDYTTQTPSIAYPAYDGNGNISEYLTEENSGFVAAHYEYDAFGNIVKKSGEKEYEYQFSTKPYNNITGQLYYNYRDYDSVSGRWIGRDPIEEYGGVNLYSFLLNNAVNFWDYLGFKVYVITYKYTANEMNQFFGGNTLGWTIADPPKYPNINVEFGDNACKAKIGNVDDIDIVVSLNLVEGTPAGYTNKGADTIRFHEYRRVMVYQKAHDAYLTKIKSTLNGKTMECKKAGESFSKLSTYKDKIINLYLDAYTSYVVKNQAEIEKEKENVIRDKNNLINGISSAHSVNNPMEVDVPEFPSCDD